VSLEDWYIDNGAPKHITKDNKNLVDFEQLEVTAANEKVLPTLGKGTLKIVATVDQKRLEVTLPTRQGNNMTSLDHRIF
ncbi:hypothetical protein AVEN_268343-1, partial [Araneus ventricosus]